MVGNKRLFTLIDQLHFRDPQDKLCHDESTLGRLISSKQNICIIFWRYIEDSLSIWSDLFLERFEKTEAIVWYSNVVLSTGCQKGLS